MRGKKNAQVTTRQRNQRQGHTEGLFFQQADLNERQMRYTTIRMG
jgi:hypothetical protein